MQSCITMESIKNFLQSHGIIILHFLQVIILSISLPSFDYIREWTVITKFYTTQNFAWGSLFLFPVLQSGIAFYVIWYSEEIKRHNLSICDVKRWKLRTWITLFLAPVYSIVRSLELLYLIFKKSTYKPEKLRISKRLVPIELFCETLPQLLILNYVLSGIIENCPDCKEVKDIIQKTTFANDLRKNIYTYIIESSTLINNTFSAITIESPTGVYSKEEVDVIKDQMGYLVVAWNLLIISSVFGLIFFLLEGPIPTMIIPTDFVYNMKIPPKNKISSTERLNEANNLNLTRADEKHENLRNFYVSLIRRTLCLSIDWIKGVYYLIEYFLGLFNRCNPIYGMLRLISQFTITLSVSQISEEPLTDQKLRWYLWLRVLIFLLLNFIPAITLQYVALLFQCTLGFCILWILPRM